MFSTIAAVVATTVFLLPGFIVADLAQRQRAGSRTLGDQRAVLRSLFYSVLIQLGVSPWTWDVAQDLDGGQWHEHYGAVALYVLVVVVLLPVCLGLALNEVLVRAERGDGHLRRWHYALGARDARDAWDYPFQRYNDKGVWVLVHLKNAPAGGGTRIVIGQYGVGAAAAQSPVPDHDLFLRELWTADEDGKPVEPYTPPRSLWVAKTEIAELYFLDTEGDMPVAPPGTPE
jgi:Family of unknown function (DUF6338)